MKQKKTKFILNSYEKYFLFIILIGFIAGLLSSCTGSNVACKGNKTMSYYGGYSRKAFKH